MNHHQTFTDLAALGFAVFAGKISTSIAQTIPAPDWMDRLTGPLGALVAMAVGIWWLSQRNKKQDEIAEKKDLAREARDDEHLRSRAEAIERMTAALESTKAVIDQNNRVLERSIPVTDRAARALEKHECVDK